MPGEAAIRKVLTRTKEWLEGQILTGVDAVLDRPFDEPFSDGEPDTANIRCDNVSFDTLSYNGWLHRADVEFDIYVPSANGHSISERQANIGAAIMGRIAARTPTAGTLGELLQDAIPISMGAPPDELMLSDQGVQTLKIRMTFLTPSNDFTTIIGHLGPVS